MYNTPTGIGKKFLKNIEFVPDSVDYITPEERSSIRRTQGFLEDLPFDGYRSIELQFAFGKPQKSEEYSMMLPVINDFVRRN